MKRRNLSTAAAPCCSFNRFRHSPGSNVGHQTTEPGTDTSRYLSARDFNRRDAIPAHPVGSAPAEGFPIQRHG